METDLRLVCLRCGHGWLRRSLAKTPGTCPRCCSPYWNRPRKGEEPPAPNGKVSALPKTAGLRPSSLPPTDAQWLQMAFDVIHALQGYRKSPDYRTIQNDLNFVREVLRRAFFRQTHNIARPRE